jgi:hypothetical protein
MLHGDRVERPTTIHQLFIIPAGKPTLIDSLERRFSRGIEVIYHPQKPSGTGTIKSRD